MKYTVLSNIYVTTCMCKHQYISTTITTTTTTMQYISTISTCM